MQRGFLHDSCTGSGRTCRTRADQTDRTDNRGGPEQVRRTQPDASDVGVKSSTPLTFGSCGFESRPGHTLNWSVLVLLRLGLPSRRAKGAQEVHSDAARRQGGGDRCRDGDRTSEDRAQATQRVPRPSDGGGVAGAPPAATRATKRGWDGVGRRSRLGAHRRARWLRAPAVDVVRLAQVDRGSTFRGFVSTTCATLTRPWR